MRTGTLRRRRTHMSTRARLGRGRVRVLRDEGGRQYGMLPARSNTAAPGKRRRGPVQVGGAQPMPGRVAGFTTAAAAHPARALSARPGARRCGSRVLAALEPQSAMQCKTTTDLGEANGSRHVQIFAESEIIGKVKFGAATISGPKHHNGAQQGDVPARPTPSGSYKTSGGSCR